MKVVRSFSLFLYFVLCQMVSNIVCYFAIDDAFKLASDLYRDSLGHYKSLNIFQWLCSPPVVSCAQKQLTSAKFTPNFFILVE